MAVQHNTTTSLYSLSKGLRTVYHAKEDSQSQVRRAESGHQVFGRDAVSSFWSYYVWEFGGFFCLTFFLVLLLCNTLEHRREIKHISPLLFLFVALELNGYLSD